MIEGDVEICKGVIRKREQRGVQITEVARGIALGEDIAENGITRDLSMKQRLRTLGYGLRICFRIDRRCRGAWSFWAFHRFYSR